MMKKLLLLFTALLFWTGSSWGQITIGDGTQDNFIPINARYDYSYSQMIYLQSEIKAAGKITTLQFYFAGNSLNYSYKWTIYLGHTTKSEFTSRTDFIPLANMTKVYDQNLNPLPSGPGWILIDIADFTYNNTDNLVIAVHENTSYHNNSENYFYSTARATKRTLRVDRMDFPLNFNSLGEGLYEWATANVILGGLVNPPKCAINTSPANGATDVHLSADLKWADGGGAPTGYKLYVGTNNPPTNIVNGTSFGLNTTHYSFASDMTPSTTYYWKVVPFNSKGDAPNCPVESFTTIADPTIRTFPYTQNFDGNWTGSPAAPFQWLVVNANNDEYTWKKSHDWIGSHSGTDVAHGTGNTDDYLITPPINLTGINAKIKWWDKVESASYPNTYKVLVSTTTADISAFTINLGTFECKNIDWIEHELDLSAYANKRIYVAFHQTASAATNYGFGIDDVTIKKIITTPVCAISPESKNFGAAFVGETSPAQTFTITNAGVLTLKVTDIAINGVDANQFTLSSVNYPINLTKGQSTTVNVTFTPTTGGRKFAALKVVHNTEGSPSTAAFTGIALTEGSLFESFEASTFPPDRWSADANSWTQKTEAPNVYHGTKTAYIYSQYSLSNQKLITPKVKLTGSESLTFYAKTPQEAGERRIQIKYSSDKTSWADAGQPITLNNSFTQYDADLASIPPGNYYLAFSASSVSNYYNNEIYLDYVMGDAIYEAPTGPATIIAPANNATNLLSNPSLSWSYDASTTGIPDGYKLYFGTDGEGMTTPTNIVNGMEQTSPYVPNIIFQYSTTYYWQVVPFNSTGNSTGCPIWKFTTMPDPTISSFPYTQNFDGDWVGTPAAPFGWTVQNANNDSYTWRRENRYITPTHSQPYAAYGSGNTNDYLISPPIDLAGVKAMIKWWDKVESAGYVNSYKVLVSTTTNDVASFTTELGTFNCANTSWIEYELSLSAFTNQTIYVAFYQFASPSSSWGFGIDDVTIEELPSCPAPQALTVSDIEVGSVKLGWTEFGNATAWNIKWGAPGFNPATEGTLVSVLDVNSHTLSGLTATTAYHFYVQSDCGSDDESLWGGPITVTTANGKAINPSPTNAAGHISLASTTLNWDDVAGATGYTITIGTSPAGNDIASGVACATSEYTHTSEWDFATTYYWTVSTVYAQGTVLGDEWNFKTQCPVTSIPYYEGFEEGNTDGAAISYCWKQEEISGVSAWTANTSTESFKKPRTGSWNAYLNWGTQRWMFQSFSLVAGKEYTFDMYARQDSENASNASIVVSYGNDANAASMTNPIVTQTSIVNGDYQFITGTITPEANGVFAIGILGQINSRANYISIDDISIYETPACYSPLALTVSNITSGSADLGWTERGDAAMWNIKYGAPGFNPANDGELISGVTSYPHTLSDLAVNTSYDWYVQAACGVGDESFWSGPKTFTTNHIAALLPYAENFEIWPNQWIVENGEQTNQWHIGSATAHSGSNAAYISNDEGLTNAYSIYNRSVVHMYRDIAFPEGLQKFDLSFWYKGLGHLEYAYLKVYIVETSYIPVAGFLLQTGQISECLCGKDNWTLFEHELSDDYSGTTKRLVFTWINTEYSGNNPPIAIDDLSIYERPSCVIPLALTAANITSNAADLGWTERNGATVWNVKYGIPGFNPATEGELISGVTENPYTLSGLESSTIYDWYVQTDCGSGDESFWAGPETFATSQIAAVLPFVENFEIWPNQWIVENGSQANQWHIGEATAHSGSKAAYISNDNGVSNDYSNDRASIVHMYRDIVFPAEDQEFDLTFWWKGMGESYYHYMRVYLVDISYTPVAGTLPETGQIGSDFSGKFNWTLFEHELSGNYSGTTKRLIISWKNNGYGGNHPLAIDDISIYKRPTCKAPDELIVQPISTFSANLSWTENGGATAWNIKYGVSGFNPETEGDVITGVLTNPYTLSGLEANTDYDFYVQADCGSGDASFWSWPTKYSMPATLPLIEKFEVSPSKWVVKNGSQTNQWHIGTATAHGGSKAAYVSYDYGISNGYSNSNTSVVHMYRDIAFPEGDHEFNLSFWWKGAGESAWDCIRVYLVDVSYSPEAGTLPETGQIGANFSGKVDWTLFEHELSGNYAGTMKRLIITWKNDGSGGSNPPAAIDDISVYIRPTCIAPVALTVTFISSVTADLGWTERGDATIWNIRYGAPGFNPESEGDLISGVKTNPYTLSGLEVTITYDVYVQADCGDGDVSFWAGPTTFTTTAFPATLPFVENFEISPNKWAVENGSEKNQWHIGTAIAHGGLQSAYISNDAGVTNDYNNSAVSVVHMYRDITFPEGAQNFNLSFWWKNYGESWYDYIKVYLVETSYTPKAGTLLPETGQIGDIFNQSNNWNLAEFELSNVSGTTKRLVFTWRNDGSGGSYPAAIDDISIYEKNPATATFTGTGNWSNPANWNPAIPSATTVVAIHGNVAVDNTFACSDLTISPLGSVTIDAGKSLTIGGNLLIQSNASGIGSFIDNGTCIVSGTKTIERYISGASYDWHLLSSPVAAQAIEGDFIPTESGYDFYSWDEPSGNWLNKKDPENPASLFSTFNPGQGYLVAYEALNPTLEFAGLLNNGPITQTLSAASSATYQHSNLLGNPYPSFIDWDLLNKTDLEGNDEEGYNIYIWNNTEENYSIYNSSTGDDNGTLGATRFISPMQGFFVIAETDGGVFAFNNEARTHKPQAGKKSGSNNAFRLSVTAPANAGKDEILLDFGHKASKGGADKWFSMSATAPSLYATTTERDYSIRFLTNVADNQLIPVAFKAGVDGEYSIQASFNTAAFTSVKLTDKLTGNVHDLNSNPFYAFNAGTGDDANRFLVTLGIDNPESAETIQVYAYEDVLYLATSSKEAALVNVYNLTGQLVMQGKTNGSDLTTFNASALSNGVYVVNVIFNQGVVSQKVVIRK